VTRTSVPPLGTAAAAPARERLAAARVLVVGDAMLDRYWFGSVERISPEAPVPVVLVDSQREQERLGGAANVAWNVQKLGARATLLTVVGEDEAGHRLEHLLETEGVETLFKRDAQLRTIVKLRVIGRGQQLLRLDFEKTPSTRCWTPCTACMRLTCRKAPRCCSPTTARAASRTSSA
jgi:rfaE bifunctional protein kinase chain/domain